MPICVGVRLPILVVFRPPKAEVLREFRKVDVTCARCVVDIKLATKGLMEAITVVGIAESCVPASTPALPKPNNCAVVSIPNCVVVRPEICEVVIDPN